MAEVDLGKTDYMEGVGKVLYVPKKIYQFVENITFGYGVEPFYSLYDLLQNMYLVDETPDYYIYSVPNGEDEQYFNYINQIKDILSNYVIAIPKDVVSYVQQHYPDFYNTYAPLVYVIDETDKDYIVASIPQVINEIENMMDQALAEMGEGGSYKGGEQNTQAQEEGVVFKLPKPLYTYIENNAFFGLQPFLYFYNLIDQVATERNEDDQYVYFTVPKNYADQVKAFLDSIIELTKMNSFRISKNLAQFIQQNYLDAYNFYVPLLYVLEEGPDYYIVGGHPDIVNEALAVVNDAKSRLNMIGHTGGQIEGGQGQPEQPANQVPQQPPVPHIPHRTSPPHREEQPVPPIAQPPVGIPPMWPPQVQPQPQQPQLPIVVSSGENNTALMMLALALPFVVIVASKKKGGKERIVKVEKVETREKKGTEREEVKKSKTRGKGKKYLLFDMITKHKKEVVGVEGKKGRKM